MTAQIAERSTAPSRIPTHSLAKVPALTALFWAVKLLTTGMGESLADFTAEKSPVILAVAGGLALVAALARQLSNDRYRPVAYWTTVSMIAVFGTVAADGLHLLGLSLPVENGVYAAVLGLVLLAWWRTEGTLSVHSITTRRRELFYWATVMISFALGTAAGDLTAFYLGWGFIPSIAVFGIAMLLPLPLYKLGLLNEVTAFWTAYVLARPLGASVADWLGKPMGVGLGDGPVAAVAIGVIVALVAYLARTGRDVQTPSDTTTASQTAAA